MSHQAVSWAYDQDIQPSGSKFVLVTLANYANSDGYCYPSQETLAKDTGQSVRAVREHIGKLEDAGCVMRERRHAKSGQRRSDGFWLIGFKPLPADVSASLAADIAGCLPADFAGGTGVLPATSVKPTGNYRQNLPADSAGLLKDEPSVEPSEEPRGYVTSVAAVTPHEFVVAFLEERGVDDRSPPKHWIDEQHKHAQRLIAMGCTLDQLRRATRYALSQDWRSTAVTLKTIYGLYGDWVMDGEPERERQKHNGRRGTRDPDFSGINAVVEVMKAREAAGR